MNNYIDMQIRNMDMILNTFVQSCEMAARKDDGKIDKAEQKQIDKIKAGTNKFKKELSGIK